VPSIGSGVERDIVCEARLEDRRRLSIVYVSKFG
jgi:hypothetical protein